MLKSKELPQLGATKAERQKNKPHTKNARRRLMSSTGALQIGILCPLPYRKIFISKLKTCLVLVRPELCCDTPRGMSAFSPVLFSLILGALDSL